MAWVPGELLQAEDRGHRAGQKARGYHVIHLLAEFDRQAAWAALAAANAADLPLEKLVPAEDLRQLREEGVWTEALLAAEDDRQRREATADAAALAATVENIDEHMVAALEAKVHHIGDVLGEAADQLVVSADVGAEGGLTRLARATEQRVRPSATVGKPIPG